MTRAIDFHGHCFQERTAPVGGVQPYCTPDELLRIYDRLGIEKGCICPEVVPEVGMFTQSNEEVLEICRRHPDRFVPFCNVDPRNAYNSASADLAWALEYYKAKGCRGLGEVQANLRIGDERVRNLFAAAECNGLPLVFHLSPFPGRGYGLVDDKGLPGLERALKDFPKLRFVGHSQAFWCEIGEYEGQDSRFGYPKGPVKEGRIAQLMRQYPNLCAELSSGSGLNALERDRAYAARFLTEFADRLFFAMDICSPTGWISTLPSLLDDMLANGEISETTHLKIVRGNAAKVLEAAV